MLESSEPTSSNSLQLKWGEALNEGFVAVPSALFRHQWRLKLDNGEVIVLMNLVMSWREIGDLPFPSTSTLARRMGVTKRTVQRHIESLEDKDLIRRILGTRVGDERRVVTRYDLSGIVAQLKLLGAIPQIDRNLKGDAGGTLAHQSLRGLI